VASSIGVYLYAADDLSEVRFLPTDAPVRSVAFSPDGRLLASASGTAPSGCGTPQAARCFGH